MAKQVYIEIATQVVKIEKTKGIYAAGTYLEEKMDELFERMQRIIDNQTAELKKNQNENAKKLADIFNDAVAQMNDDRLRELAGIESANQED